MSESHITYKPAMCRALTQRGYGTAAMNLANDPSEDAFGIVNALVNQFDSEVRAKVEQNPLLMACDSSGIKSGTDLAALIQKATIGEQARAKLQSEAYEACVRANGPDIAGIIAKGLDDVPYAALAAKRDAWEAEAEVKIGYDKAAGGKRVSAPTELATPAAAAKDADQAPATKRRWDRMDPDDQAKAKKDFGLDTEVKQDAFAARISDSLLKVAA